MLQIVLASARMFYSIATQKNNNTGFWDPEFASFPFLILENVLIVFSKKTNHISSFEYIPAQYILDLFQTRMMETRAPTFHLHLNHE